MAARSRWVTGNLPYRDRSLRILVTPTPVTFAERRSILQVLERHGPIEVFKKTPEYQSNFISVAKTAETAGRLIEASPLTYTLETGDAPDLSLADLTQPRRLDGARPRVRAGVGMSTDTGAADVRERRTFTIEVYGQEGYNHAGTFASTQLHASWPPAVAADETFASRTLGRSLPHSVARAGLSRWEADAHARSPAAKKSSRLEVQNWLPSRMLRGAGKG